MQPIRLALALVFLLAAACSMRSAIETLTSPEDRAFAQEMVTRLRSGDEAWLQRHFDPALWAESGKQLAQVPSLYPAEIEETEIVGAQTSTNMAGGRTERNKEFTLVSHGGGRWTTTTFRTYSNGGPDRVVQWRVTPHDQPPPELTMMETWDSMVPWVWTATLIALGALVALIVWLVRRSRRRDPLMGQTGTP